MVQNPTYSDRIVNDILYKSSKLFSLKQTSSTPSTATTSTSSSAPTLSAYSATKSDHVDTLLEKEIIEGINNIVKVGHQDSLHELSNCKNTSEQLNSLSITNVSTNNTSKYHDRESHSSHKNNQHYTPKISNPSSKAMGHYGFSSYANFTSIKDSLRLPVTSKPSSSRINDRCVACCIVKLIAITVVSSPKFLHLFYCLKS